MEREEEGAGDGVTWERERWRVSALWRGRGVMRERSVRDASGRVRERRWARVSFLYIYCGIGVGPRWPEIDRG